MRRACARRTNSLRARSTVREYVRSPLRRVACSSSSSSSTRFVRFIHIECSMTRRFGPGPPAAVSESGHVVTPLHRVVKSIPGISFHHEPEFPRRLEQQDVPSLAILHGHHARCCEGQRLGVAGFRHRPPAGDVCQRFERAGNPYSARRRASTTSNCSGPTTPTIGCRSPVAGTNTCIRPSSSSCRTASSKRLWRTSAGRM